MRIIVSTIPPRKDSFGEVPFDPEQYRRAQSGDRRARRVEGHRLHRHPRGVHGRRIPRTAGRPSWRTSGGTIPSPAGHTVIADLFANVLAAFPPRRPEPCRQRSPPKEPTVRRFRWDPGCESDLCCYRVEYGPAPSALENLVVTNANTIVFPGFPSHDVYFRVQSVDAAGYRSDFTRIIHDRGEAADAKRPSALPRPSVSLPTRALGTRAFQPRHREDGIEVRDKP